MAVAIKKCDFCGEPAEFVYNTLGEDIAVCYKHDRAIRIISAEEVITYLKECLADPLKDLFKLAYRVKQIKPSQGAREPVEKTVIFKVTYLGQLGMGWKEEVSRVIELKETQTLIDLHKAIYESTGWNDPHLYTFFMDGKAWSKDKSKQYTCPEDISEKTVNYLGYKPNTADIEIKSLNLHPRQRFLYIFDFGDEQQFSVKVQGFGEVKEGVKYPRFIEESTGKMPPQYPSSEDAKVLESAKP